MAHSNPFKVSPLWYFLGILFLVVGLIFGAMIFFQNPTPGDNGNINRATLGFLAAIAFAGLAIYQATREEYKGVVKEGEENIVPTPYMSASRFTL